MIIPSLNNNVGSRLLTEHTTGTGISVLLVYETTVEAVEAEKDRWKVWVREGKEFGTCLQRIVGVWKRRAVQNRHLGYEKNAILSLRSCSVIV